MQTYSRSDICVINKKDSGHLKLFRIYDENNLDFEYY